MVMTTKAMDTARDMVIKTKINCLFFNKAYFLPKIKLFYQ